MVIILYLWYIQNGAPKLRLMAQPLKHPQSEYFLMNSPNFATVCRWCSYCVDAVLEDAFRLFDKDGDGSITSSELQSVMNSLGQPVDIRRAKEMITSVDKDGKNPAAPLKLRPYGAIEIRLLLLLLLLLAA